MDNRKGTVAWFDASSGQGMIHEDNGGLYYVHYSAIESSDNFKTLTRGQRVTFTLYRNLYMAQVDTVKQLN